MNRIVTVNIFSVIGFTLLELAIVGTIIFVIVSISIPSLTPILERKSVEQTSHELFQSFELAKITASRISDITLLCPLPQPEAVPCTSWNWNNGWGLYKPNRDSLDEPLVLIKRYDPPKRNTVIKAKTERIIFKKDGFIHIQKSSIMRVCNPNHLDTWTRIKISKKGIEFLNNYSDKNSIRCNN